MMQKTYLVTGGAGFIGSNYIRALLDSDRDIQVINLDKLTYAGNLENLRGVEQDPRYTFVHGDICDGALLQKLFAENPVDYLVHFAAESHVDRSIEGADEFVRSNVNGTVALLNAAMAAWREGEGYKDGVKFLQVSTDEVYGSLGPEGLFCEETPLDPHSPYSASKAAGDLMAKAFYDTHRLPVNITRCSNNYGPYQFPEKLIPLMINNCRQHKPLPVYGDGKQVRDWLHVADHCAAIELVLTKARAGEVYNIGGQNERENLQIVQAILDYMVQRDSEVGDHLIQHVTDRKGHDRRYAIDAIKIHRDLGWQPRIFFEEGIRQTLDWYMENGDWVDHVTSGSYQDYYQQMYGNR